MLAGCQLEGAEGGGRALACAATWRWGGAIARLPPSLPAGSGSTLELMVASGDVMVDHV